MSVVCTATEDHAEVCDNLLTLEAMWDVCALYCHQKLFMLLPKTICKSIIQAPAHCKGQESYFCHGIDYCRFTVEKEGHRSLMWQPLSLPSHPQKSNSLDRKPIKRTLNSCDKDAEV